MTVPAPWQVKHHCLYLGRRALLTGIPKNLVVTPIEGNSAAFVGVEVEFPQIPRSRQHVFSLGVIQRKTWMVLTWGQSGADVPPQTNGFIFEVRDESELEGGDGTSENREVLPYCLVTDGAGFYVLLLPIVSGDFHASLQWTAAYELQLCVESGTAAVQTSQALKSLFINSGDNPHQLWEESKELLRKLKVNFDRINFAVDGWEKCGAGLHHPENSFDIAADMRRHLSSEQQLTKRSRRPSEAESASSIGIQPYPITQSVTSNANADYVVDVKEDLERAKVVPEDRNRVWDLQLKLALATGTANLILTMGAQLQYTVVLYITVGLNVLSIGSMFWCCILIVRAVKEARDGETPAVSHWVWRLILFTGVCFMGSFCLVLFDKLKRGSQKVA